MKRKSFILFLVSFLVISISTICLATDTDTGNNIKNAVNGATNTVVDGAQNLAEDARNAVGTAENVVEDGIGDVGNVIEDGTNDVGNAIMDGENTNEDTGDNAYVATRNATDDLSTTDDNMNTSIWIWVTLAIAAVVIVGLVWYYASQNNKH